MTTPLARYQEIEITTMSPERRVVFLYSLLLVNLTQAKHCFETGAVERRVQHMIKAQDVLGELIASLDHERGGAIAARLAQLYGWFLTELLRINRQRDVRQLERVTEMIRELSETWQAAAEQCAVSGAA